MAYCPSCSLEIAADTLKCPRCSATFGPESTWRPLEAKPVRSSFTEFCLKAIGYIFFGTILMIAGAAYGIFAYELFGKLYSRPADGASGLMLASFLAGVPLALGMLVGYLAIRRKKMGAASAGALATLSVSLFMIAAGAALREGTICIAMAAPLFIVLAAIGAGLGVLASSAGESKGPKLLSVALIAPVFFGLAEEQITSPTARQTTIESIYIASKPEIIWRHLNYPLDIKPQELGDGFAYRIGVPYPIEARTLEERIGGKRTLRWERGVTFDEEITAWEPNRHIAWIYKFHPDSFPPGSLDDHIVIGGRYFNLEGTSYTLHPEGAGTRLTIVVETSVTTNFNWYAGLWAKYLIADTAQAILQFYKTRSEFGRSG